MRVAVIGAGAWGTTVASMLAARHETVLWAREPEVTTSVSADHTNPTFLADYALAESLTATSSLEEALDGREALVLAVPAQFIRGVAERLAPLLGVDVVVLSLAKGIEQDTLLRPTQVVAEVVANHNPALLGVMTGPNLAREVMAGDPSASVVALADQGWTERLQSVLTGDRFRVYTSVDVAGCEIGGAVKNVVAIAAGMADGLGYGWNSRAALITRGLAEMTRLGVALGGQPLTFLGLAGNGDLIATCSSPQSRNRRVGVELAKGRGLDDILGDKSSVAEGATSTPAVLALAAGVGVELPIAEQSPPSCPARGTLATRSKRSCTERPPPSATSELHDLAEPPLRS